MIGGLSALMGLENKAGQEQGKFKKVGVINQNYRVELMKLRVSYPLFSALGSK
jgi:hypothetical protein